MIITNFQIMILGFSLKNTSYDFVDNDGIYSVGERGEESHKIAVAKAFRGLLASYSSHELFAKHIDTIDF